MKTIIGKKDKARKLLESGCDAAEEGRLDIAVKKFIQSSRMGNIEAQNNLACLYSDGSIKDKNADRSAVYWYKRAHEHGSTIAAYNLALHYKDRKNFRWFRYWMKKAADAGDDDAIALLKGDD